MILDIGAFTPFIHALREREHINDLLEELCGARLTYNYMRIGGVACDLPPGLTDKTRDFLDTFEPVIDEFNDLISFNKIYVERLANVARDHRRATPSATTSSGPNLRASGVGLRRAQGRCRTRSIPSSTSTSVGSGEVGTVGDCFDRYMVRIREMQETLPDRCASASSRSPTGR